MKKISFNNRRFEKKKTRLKGEWQEYAIDVCQRFNIKPPYSSIIFKQAKRNIAFLKGKVSYVQERFGDVSDKGRYLISLFRKK